jgi:hypothetical protein
MEPPQAGRAESSENHLKEAASMAEIGTFTTGGYRFIKGVFQYSGGVAAEPGWRITRVMFSTPLPLAAGFAAAERIMARAGRQPTAFCACELRSPAPFTEAGFRSFNEIYVGTLARWGIFDGATNPVARSNVCPLLGAPPEPSMHAFSFTEPAEASDAPSFVVAGSGEAREGAGTYEEKTVRLGDVSPGGMLEKAQFVLDEMERRMTSLGFGWADTTAVQVYTVHDVHPFMESEIAARGAARHGLTWHLCRPPVIGLEYEMDCRGVARERIEEG